MPINLVHASACLPPARRLLPASLVAIVLFWCLGAGALADGPHEVRVAVAANFAGPMERIGKMFEAETGYQVVVVGGATGALATQVRNGAPFDLLLAADEETPRKLEEEGFGAKGQRYTYATGRLVLYSAQAGFVDGEGKVLAAGQFEHLAIANPRVAPYGIAARDVLQALGLADTLASRIVEGESIGQTFAFVRSGNAELGFVALSQVAPPDGRAPGSWWVVPAKLYHPIRQDLVLLRHGNSNPAAAALYSYLRTKAVRDLIQLYGYQL